MTHQRTDYEAFIAESNENRRAVRQRELIIEVTEAIYAEMERSHITKGQLAARLGRTPAFVTQILNGGRNLTLKTIADVADALGVNVRLRLEPVSVQRELPTASEVLGKVLPFDARRKTWNVVRGPEEPVLDSAGSACAEAL